MRLSKDVPARTQEGHDALASTILGTAKPLVPVKTGQLRDSGHIVHRGNQTVVEFSAPYAGEVHERLDVPHPNGGQAKYLEIAANQADLGIIDQHFERAFQ